MAALTNRTGLSAGMETLKLGTSAIEVPSKRADLPSVPGPFIVTRLLTEASSVREALVEARRARTLIAYHLA